MAPDRGQRGHPDRRAAADQGRAARRTWQRGARRAGPRPGRRGAADLRAAHLPFQPGQSGFASVFVGFYPVALVIWLPLMIWLEILHRSRTARSRRSHSWSSRLPMRETFEVQRFQSCAECFHRCVELPRHRGVHLLAVLLCALSWRPRVSALPLADGPAMFLGGSILSFVLPMAAFIVITGGLFYLYRRPHRDPRLKYLEPRQSPRWAPGSRARFRPRRRRPRPLPGPPPPRKPWRPKRCPRRRRVAPRLGRRTSDRPETRRQRGYGVTSLPSALPAPAAGHPPGPPRAAAGGGEPATAAGSPPPGDRPGAGRADQAADHRAAAGHHGADDAARPARPARRCGCSLVTLLGGTLAAGSANTINCYLDRDIDAVMKRTSRRPLVNQQGAVKPAEALAWGIVLGAGATAAARPDGQLARRAAGRRRDPVLRVRLHAAAQAAHPSNIVIGGAAGCFPVLVGWAAVKGTVAVPAIVLFAVIFLWTPPHFWALAMKFRDDYAAADVPMLPVVAAAGGGDQEDRLVLLRDGRRHAGPRPVRRLDLRRAARSASAAGSCGSAPPARPGGPQRRAGRG